MLFIFTVVFFSLCFSVNCCSIFSNAIFEPSPMLICDGSLHLKSVGFILIIPISELLDKSSTSSRIECREIPQPISINAIFGIVFFSILTSPYIYILGNTKTVLHLKISHLLLTNLKIYLFVLRS